MGDRGADHGETARGRRGAHAQPSAHSCHSRSFSSCSAQVSANLVSPVSVLTVTKYSQSPAGGSWTASRDPAPGEAIGPGGSPVCRYVLYGLSVARSASVVPTLAFLPVTK